jgi:hypothetical protein
MIGFGQIEIEGEENLKSEIETLVAEQYKNAGIDYFTDEFLNSIKAILSQWAEDSRRQGDVYKDSPEFPDRYFYYWAYIVGDCNHLFFKINIHHINRRHALSGDGWGMMQNSFILCISSTELEGREESQFAETAALSRLP